MNQRTVWMLVLNGALVAEVSAQQFVYPAKGQSPQQPAANQQQQAAFPKAGAACLEGCGYPVR